MKQTGIFGMLLLGGMLAAEPWICDFESGTIDTWTKKPSASTIEVVDDGDAAHGKVLKLMAQNAVSGINTPAIAVPAGTAGKPWIIEFDLHTKEAVVTNATINFLCLDGSGKLLKQFALNYVTPKLGAFAWTHFKFHAGTGKRMLPENTANIQLRFVFWNREANCNGTVFIDNIKIVPPSASGETAAAAADFSWNFDFESGIAAGWIKDKGRCIAGVVDDPVKGKVLQLKVKDGIGGIETEKIVLTDADRNDLRQITFDAKGEGVTSGVGSLCIRIWDANGKFLKQYPFAYFNSKNTDTGWKSCSSSFGGTGARAFPGNAASYSIRFNLWSKDGKANGTLSLDNVKVITTEKGPAAPAVPAAPERVVTDVKLPNGWVAAPEGNVTLADDGAIVLTASQDCVGINGKPVALEGALSANITCNVAVDAVSAGKLTLSVLALDQQGKRLKQIDLKQFKQGDRCGKTEFSFQVGDGGIAALPPGTVSLQPRAVFWDQSLQCTGTAKIYEMDILAEI